MSTDPRIDSYIERRADFARPILEHLRRIVRSACPKAEETLKWGMPHFLYRGQMLAGMAAFKAHATFGFRRAGEVLGETGAKSEAMGQFGRLASVADLPPDDVLRDLVGKAMALTDSGGRSARDKTARSEIEIPPELVAALDSSPEARATFDAFPPGCRREYVDWVVEAKRPQTATGASPRLSNGWPRARGVTGNTRNADAVPGPGRRSSFRRAPGPQRG